MHLEDFAGAADDGAGKSGESGDFDTVALVRSAGFDSVEEDNAARVLADCDAHIAQVGEAICEEREFVVMRSEERAAADGVVEVLDRCPGE